MESISTWWMWLGFCLFIVMMILIDLLAFSGKHPHKVSAKEALTWSLIWISLALIFNFLLWMYLMHYQNAIIANQKAAEFFAGYILEKSLSVDNIFVFLMIFQYFAVPDQYQRRILVLGVLGAVVMRAIMILFGVWLVNQFNWVLYLFGILLIYTGFKMFFSGEEQKDLSENVLLKFLQKHLRFTTEINNEKLMVIKKGVRYFTPLLLVLIFIEISDLIFAIDSIPAIFGITRDPFIVFTSNIFAILGLRALYFLFANVANRFALLKYGISLILIFIGCKMLVAHWFKIPIGIALGVIVVTLTGSILLSLIYTPNKEKLSKPH